MGSKGGRGSGTAKLCGDRGRTRPSQPSRSWRCSGSHLREPPCTLFQALPGIFRQSFSSSSAWTDWGSWCDSVAVFALQARGHWFDPSCAHEKDQVRVHIDLFQDQPRTITGATRASSRAWKRAHRVRAAASSSITRMVSNARTAGTTGTARARRRGEISKGFWPDGRRRRYKVSGQTKQDVGRLGNGVIEPLEEGGAAVEVKLE